MTRRTFQKQAALFVMGCALQVCGALPRVKVPEAVEDRTIPNPAWEAAKYRVAFEWHRMALGVMSFSAEGSALIFKEQE